MENFDNIFQLLPLDVLLFRLLPLLRAENIVPISLVDKFSRSLVIRFYENEPDRLYLLSKNYLNYAARSSLNQFNWGLEMGCRLDCQLFEYAAEGSHWDVVEFLNSKLDSFEIDKRWFRGGRVPEILAVNCNDERVLSSPLWKHIPIIDTHPAKVESFRVANMDYLKYTIEKNGEERFFQSMRTYHGGVVGSLKILDLAFEILGEGKMSLIGPINLCYPDAESIRYFKEKGLKWGVETVYNAAQYSDVQILEEMFGSYELLPFKGEEQICYRAAMGGKIENLKFLKQKGKPIRDFSCWGAINEWQIETLLWILESEGIPRDNPLFLEVSATRGDFTMFKYFAGERTDFDGHVELAVIKSGNLTFLKRMIEGGHTIKSAEKCITTAAWMGYLNVLKFLVQHLKFSADDFASLPSLTPDGKDVSDGGHLKVLQYLIENGYRTSPVRMGNSALIGGHTHLLKWVVEREGPTILEKFANIEGYGHHNSLKRWALQRRDKKEKKGKTCNIS
eukprot:TRINITY_DN8151_c0_g1_i2.p1 TRINITY_DN8151_c0_g1~~TRINITY_DN8151_c0_g1_i2.p1  ORF type:complete len:506 (-),score=73.49 TRINITY_DN8151_c0_g1_i2:191-1708(-)